MRYNRIEKNKMLGLLVFTFSFCLMICYTARADVAQQEKLQQIYQLEEPFIGDGNAAYIDTGIALFDGNIEDWILIACISNKLGDGNNVFLSCFSEKEPYRGLLLRNPSKNSYEFVCGATGYQLVYGEDANYLTIAVQKKADNYTIFYNGEIVKQFDSDAENYDGSLLIGCQEDEEGRLFRFSSTNISELVIYEGTQSPSITAKSMEEMLKRNNDTKGSVTKRVIINRDYEDETTLGGLLFGMFRENGYVILLLTSGFIIACFIVWILDRRRKG